MMSLFLLPLAPLAAALQAGGYLSVWKAIPVLVILLVWTRLLTWVDKDAEAAYLPREAINGGFMGGAVLAFALFFFLPNFWICLGILLFVFAAEMGTYLFIRQKKEGLSHLRGQMKDAFTPKAKDKAHKAVAGEVALIGKNGNVVTPPLAESPEAAGFTAGQTLLSDPVVRGAERVGSAPSVGAAEGRDAVDGVPCNGASMAFDPS